MNREAAQKYDSQKRIRCFSAMGRTWMLQEENDSAFYYLRERWNMAIKSSDSLSQSLLAQNPGVAYAEVGAYERADYESALDYQQQECELMEEIAQQRAEQLPTEGYSFRYTRT